MSDIAARPVVDLVVGFGGVVTRERVRAEADVFITANSLAPIVPLALAPAERAKLTGPAAQAALQKGLALLQGGEVIFKGQ